MRELTASELQAVSGAAAEPVNPRPIATPPVRILARVRAEEQVLLRFVREEEQILARVKTGPEL
jgi:hypothetical protein